MSQVKIVWFKRDLRIDDHAPLYHAAQNHAEKGGKILPLLVIEPDFWAQPDSSARQFAFMRESALSLAQALRALGAELVVRTGEVCAVLEQLSGLYEIEGIYAHQETHNNWTYQRDRAVRSWAQSRGIALYEYQQHGVI
ncbi:MAG: deoxyribodipyrimidine photo-lyase, partial [Candidatus Puniceispirillaceae bacterium]